jgi:hypothetical protein
MIMLYTTFKKVTLAVLLVIATANTQTVRAQGQISPAYLGLVAAYILASGFSFNQECNHPISDSMYGSLNNNNSGTPATNTTNT